MSDNIKKPEIFSKREEAPAGAREVDAFHGALRELFFIRHPQWKNGMPEAEESLRAFLEGNKIDGVWIYFPWADTVAHSLPEELYFELRTARNRNIISKEEQKYYREMNVGVVGLSVGSAVLSALSVSGGPKTMKIADFDTVEVTNLNRIKAKLLDVGEDKTKVAAREIWELDPFADLELWSDGVNENNIEKFILGDSPLDVFIDEMDSIHMKILSRLICKKHNIPVLMATDNGDNVILDVERFDLEPERPLFHGLIGNVAVADVKNLDFKQWVRLATKIVGPEYLPERMQNSLLEIGKTISAVPQLGTTAQVAGSAMAYVVRKIANKQEMPSGRYVINFEEKLELGYNSPLKTEERNQRTKKFADNFTK